MLGRQEEAVLDADFGTWALTPDFHPGPALAAAAPVLEDVLPILSKTSLD